MTSVSVVAAGSEGAAGGRGAEATAWLRRWSLLACALLAACAAQGVPAPAIQTADRDEPPVPSGAGLEGLTPADPFECRGDEQHVLDSVVIQTDGNGVTLDGPCTVVIRHSHIAAGANGIEIFGTGRVQVIDSVIEGADNAVRLRGAGRLGARGSRFRGSLERAEAARYIDGGNNLWEE
jgi:hypothetical protein